ncbi:hypothetical protein cgR_0558 [Corynebacterium glutamicum R]|uniref:Uncharacterized protein n=1 Tax=Corynebacterium glutamicum (strain R) TaxID=340322 RepID=A0AB72V8S0_CORGB|nr:hypothetical protein cgR_0558 [Corynebacterium glutamicum R]
MHNKTMVIQLYLAELGM